MTYNLPDLSLQMARRGYQPLYRGPQTSCPGCTLSNWLVGRSSAECGFCTTALPLAPEKELANG